MEDVSHSRRCMQTSSIKREAKEENSIQSLIMEINNLNQNLPPGFRFHPTDEELVAYYLHTKLSDHGFSPYAIADVDFNKSEPWDLPDKAKIGEKEWYFFSLRDRKYPTGHRTNRATNSGYWKTTGKDKEIFHGETQVGMKKTLVFYKGRAPRGEKTNWIMHEYRHQTKNVYRPPEEEWVVFRIFRKPDSCKKLLLLKSSALASASSQSYQAPTIDSPCRINDTTKAGDFITAVHDGEIPVLYNQQPADVTPPTSFNQFASTSCNNIISSSRMDMRKNWTSVAEDAVADDQHQQQYYDPNWPGSLLHESNLLSNSDIFSGEMRFGFYPQEDAFVDNTG